MSISHGGSESTLHFATDRIIRIRTINDSDVIETTRRWLERAVIGLRLCPFAERVYLEDRVRFRVSRRRTAAELLDELRVEAMQLWTADPKACETTLLIHPWALNDFLEFNDFLDACEGAIRDAGLEGDIQVASFHPQYQFAGTSAGDIENYTNRSPYPTLHLLREASIERALAGMPDPAVIYEHNILKLRALGLAGWNALFS